MFTGMNKYGRGSLVHISTVYWALLTCFLWKRPFKRDFTDIYRIIFFGDANLGNKSARGSSFFPECSKFNVDFENAEKN